MLGRTVRELEAELSYLELLDWYDYWRLEPFGDEVQDSRGDARNALLCKLVSDFNYWMAGQKSPHKLLDFTLGRPEQSEQEPPAEERRGAKISEELLTQLFLVSAQPSKTEH